MRRGFSQPAKVPLAAVEVVSGASSYAFNTAFADATTPSGHGFHARAGQWPFPAATCAWFGDATLNGRFAMGSMTNRLNEINKTQQQTTISVFDPATNVLQVIPIPTTLGYTNPPNSDGATSGAPVDTVRALAIAGSNYIFAVAPTAYGGWQIATYGRAYSVIALKEQPDGSYAFDATHSYTADQLAASGAAGAACFPAKTNSFSETYYDSCGLIPLVVGPQSGHLITGQYFYQTGRHSGALIAIDPANGTVLAYNQLPDVTANDATDLNISIRDIAINPASAADDERFIVTPDVFIRSGGNYPNALMEFSYNSTAQTITLLSPPTQPYTPPGLAYDFRYNLAAFDDDGNLYCGTHGGTGLGVFTGHELHMYRNVGGNLPTLEGGGTVSVSNFAVKNRADFRFGTFSTTNGFDQSINYDSANNRIIVINIGGIAKAITPQTPLVTGSEILTNTDFSDGTITGWNVFFSPCTLAAVAAADFPSGFALHLTATGNGNISAASAKFAVTPGQSFMASVLVEAASTPRTTTLQIFWFDSSNVLLSAANGPAVTDAVGSTLYLETFGAAPAAAATGQIFLNFASAVNGEVHLASEFSWKSQPALEGTTVDLNKVRFSGGAVSQHNKGAIINGRLYSACLQSSTGVTSPPYPSKTQWLSHYDLTAHN